MSGGDPVLVLGDGDGLGSALAQRLEAEGAAAEHRIGLADADIEHQLRAGPWSAVAVVTRDDVLALRLTLLCAHLEPALPLLTTLFDRTAGRKLQSALPNARIVSPAVLAADDLATRCQQEGARPVSRFRRGVGVVDDALRLLVGAGVGLAVGVAIEAVASMLALDHGPIDAIYFSARTVTTVGAATEAAEAPGWFKLVSAADMLASLALVAVFTAALVRRLNRPRLTSLLGRRAPPTRGHVLVVGLGQVGFRLAQRLERSGIPVLAVEQDAEAPCVRLAKAAGIPVAIARGDDRQTLRRLGVARCAVVAAVTSDDLVNVATGLAATDLVPEVPVVLRLGDGNVATETDSLLHLGSISDAHDVAASALATMLRSDSASQLPHS